MPLFLDSTHNFPSNEHMLSALIHSYNKKCFSNYEEAYKMLLNKVLFPGEIAIAYYFDASTEYGQNAIIALGPLTHGGGNIIFKNELLINKLNDNILSNIADVDASINYLREDLEDSMEKLEDRLYALVNGNDNRITHIEDDLSNFITSTNTDILQNSEDIYQMKLQISALNEQLRTLLENMNVNSSCNCDNTIDTSIIDVDSSNRVVYIKGTVVADRFFSTLVRP